MTRQQLAILQRNGSVTISDNGHGFSANVVRNAGRSAARKSDPNDEGDDPDDRIRTSAVESVQERESRLAEGRRVSAQIEANWQQGEIARIAKIDRVLALATCPEVLDELLFIRNNGFELGLVWNKVLKLELEFRGQLNLVQEFRRESLGLKSETNASRASAFLDDPDKDVRQFARLVLNRELLPGEKADQEAEEAEPTRKKGKRGDRSADKKDFEEAEAGKVAEPGETGSDDPDAVDIDSEMEKFYASQGWI